MDTTVRPSASHDDRGQTLARLFDAVGDGLYAGVLALAGAGPDQDATLAANPALKALLGYPPSTPDCEIRPLAPARFVDPAERADLLERLRSEGAVAGQPLRLRHNDGSVIAVEITAHAQAGSGSLISLEALIRPRQTSNPGGEPDEDHARRLSALGQAISSVAHELNNPLATIISWSERLSDRSPEPSLRGIEIIATEAHRAARIIRNLLAFAHKRQTTRTRVDVNQIVVRTLALRAEEQRALNVRAETIAGGDLPDTLADGHQIQQVLLNLVINAEHAMATAHGGGVLRVQTSTDARRSMVTLEVSDDGPGVPQHLRNRIFDPFFTTKEMGQGTGLGLAVAETIVRDHGGRIRVAAREPRGTSFFVDLPVYGTDSQWPDPPPVLPAALRGAAVLLVEDAHPLAAAVAASLSEAGLTVDHAGDGEEALARVRRTRYDVVICDLQMPHMNGMMLYRAIAAATPALARRVIFVTGEVAGTDVERFLADSGCRWLAKPFRLDDLLRAVRDTLA